MQRDIWVGIAELSHAPLEDRPNRYSSKGTFTWWACTAADGEAFKARVTEACLQHGLFVAKFENVMAYQEALNAGRVGDDLEVLVERASQDGEFCIFEALQSYTSGN